MGPHELSWASDWLRGSCKLTKQRVLLIGAAHVSHHGQCGCRERMRIEVLHDSRSWRHKHKHDAVGGSQRDDGSATPRLQQDPQKKRKTKAGSHSRKKSAKPPSIIVKLWLFARRRGWSPVGAFGATPGSSMKLSNSTASRLRTPPHLGAFTLTLLSAPS